MTTSNVHLLRAEEDCAAINTNISYYSDELVRYSKKMMIELETAKSTLEANKYVFTKEQRDYLNSEIRKLQSEQVTTLSRYSEILTKLREEYTLCLQKYPDQVPAPANSNQTESGASSESSPTTSSETKTDIFTLCQNDFGTNATNFGENQCTCKEGYEWNSGQTSCQLKRTPEQACQEQYGAFAKDAGSGRCGCKS